LPQVEIQGTALCFHSICHTNSTLRL